MPKPVPAVYREFFRILCGREADRRLSELMKLAESGEYDRRQVCEGVNELITFRSDSWQPLEPTLASRVFRWLSAYWPEDLKELDEYLSVLVNTGTRAETVALLRRRTAESADDAERALIQAFLDEFEDDWVPQGTVRCWRMPRE